jgi:hypothetical protein
MRVDPGSYALTTKTKVGLAETRYDPNLGHGTKGTGFQWRTLSLTVACVIAGGLIPDGDTESNIPERSRMSFDGVPYVLGFTDVDDSSTNSTSMSVIALFSVLRGDGARIIIRGTSDVSKSTGHPKA